MAADEDSKSFRLLKRTRQTTEYSCGPSALQSVLSYWGKDVDEAELMKLLHTTAEEGTYPDDIARGARALGFEAEVKDNLTLDEVARFTADGTPMIALAQVWRSARDATASVENEWGNGHYIAVLAVDKDYVYFQDPYVRMSKAFVPRKAFEDHWHQVMGGDPERNPKLMHLGILIRGTTKPAAKDAETSAPALDFRKFGSLNLIVIRFRGYLLPYDFLTEIKETLNDQLVRPNAFILLRKDGDGNVSGLEGSDLDDEQEAVAMNAVIESIAQHSLGDLVRTRSNVEHAIEAAAQGDFGLSAGEIREIATKLPPEHSALIVLFENVWERRFREISEKYDGTIINQRLVTSDAVTKAASALMGAASSA
jgi:predicted double-glycine peptidase